MPYVKCIKKIEKNNKINSLIYKIKLYFIFVFYPLFIYLFLTFHFLFSLSSQIYPDLIPKSFPLSQPQLHVTWASEAGHGNESTSSGKLSMAKFPLMLIATTWALATISGVGKVLSHMHDFLCGSQISETHLPQFLIWTPQYTVFLPMLWLGVETGWVGRVWEKFFILPNWVGFEETKSVDHPHQWSDRMDRVLDWMGWLRSVIEYSQIWMSKENQPIFLNSMPQIPTPNFKSLPNQSHKFPYMNKSPKQQNTIPNIYQIKSTNSQIKTYQKASNESKTYWLRCSDLRFWD